MNIHHLSDNLSATGQVRPADMSAIVEAGFRSLICARPDDEEPGQPSFAEVEAAAKAAGLEARYVPVRPGMMTPTHAAAFDQAMRELPGPVLGYCRSGGRVASLCQAVTA